MNKFLVLACILLSLGLVYFKRKNDQYKKELEKQQKLVDMLRAGIEKPLEVEQEEPSQLFNLATSAISPLIAFIGPNLLKKKTSFLKESINVSDFELSEQLKELENLEEDQPKIVELTSKEEPKFINKRDEISQQLAKESEAIAQEIQTFVEIHNPETAIETGVESIVESSTIETVESIVVSSAMKNENGLVTSIENEEDLILLEKPTESEIKEETKESPKINKRKTKRLYAHPALDPCFGKESCPIR